MLQLKTKTNNYPRIQNANYIKQQTTFTTFNGDIKLTSSKVGTHSIETGSKLKQFADVRGAKYYASVTCRWFLKQNLG